MASRIAVGIDLGTTNSAAAWIDPSEKSAMLRNSEGEVLTPSVVFFDDAEVVVGKEARRVAAVHPDRVAQWVKRDMGSPVYSRRIRGEFLPPEVIQASILRKMKADIAAAVGPGSQAVLTVPAYFDEPRRKATADAGEMAGLALLDIVNEPTAAALGFGEVLGYLGPHGGLLDQMTVMVYDLGGGTFDATLLRLAPGDIRTLATDGDVQLGGHDWDARFVDFAAAAFQQAGGPDPREDPAALNQLYDAAVEAKHTLSARPRATIRIVYAGTVLEVPVTREQFEEMTADLLERTAYTSRQLLAAAGLEWSDVSRVLLVGGSTRMPMVPAMLHRLTAIVPDRTVNPDEAVARGAALYAHWLLSSPQQGGAGATFQVTNVNSHSLGVEGIDADTLRKVNVILIPRNTPLPAQVTERFATKAPDQRSIVIQVLEGESRSPDDCTPIGRAVIRDLPGGLPKGWPIEVTFVYGANGRLSVRGAVPGTNREVALDVERDVGLSREGVSRLQKAVGSAAGFDQFDAMVQGVLGAGKGERGTGDGGRGTAGEGREPPEFVEPSVPILSQPTPLFVADIPHLAAGEYTGGSAKPKADVPSTDYAVRGAEYRVLDTERGVRSTEHEGRSTAYRALDSETDTAVEPNRRPVAAGHGVGRLVVSVIGYVVSAAAGIALAYWLVSWLAPGVKLPKLW